MPPYVNDTLIQPADFAQWGWEGDLFSQSPNNLPMTSYLSQDILIDSLQDRQNVSILEMRVLSTYRATVRVRALTYQDTTVDKFLYRKRTSSSTTHSLNTDGTIGGYDSIVAARLAVMHATLNSISKHTPFEMDFTDIDARTSNIGGGLATPMFGYMDYMGSADSIFPHWHEQGYWGVNTLNLRRARMSFDGNPPSLNENENAGLQTGIPGAPFPGDYMYYSHNHVSSAAWLASGDSMMGMGIVRPVTGTSDSLAGYRNYDSSIAGLWFLGGCSRRRKRHFSLNLLVIPMVLHLVQWQF
jgi:hypothetical protein